MKSGVSDDRSLLLVVFCIQHVMLDALSFEHTAQELRHLDRDRADQDRLPCGMRPLYFFNNRFVFFFFCLVNRVFQIHSLYRDIGRDLHYVHPVNITEFFFLCKSSTCHTALLFKFIEQVLECDCCKCLAFPSYLHMFLRLDRLVKTVRITASRHDTSCKLIHDHDLALRSDHIVLILEHQVVRAESKDNIVLDLQILRICKIINMEELLYLSHAVFRKVDRLFLLVYDEIAGLLDVLAHNSVHFGKFAACLASLKLTGKYIAGLIELCGFSALPGNDKRCPCLIDQYGVHLIDDCKMQPPLHELFFINNHIVTQIIKSEFIVRDISDVACISLAALLIVHAV